MPPDKRGTGPPEPAPHSCLPSCHPGDSSLRPGVSPRSSKCRGLLAGMPGLAKPLTGKARPQSRRWGGSHPAPDRGTYVPQLSRGLRLPGALGPCQASGQRTFSPSEPPEWGPGEQLGGMRPSPDGPAPDLPCRSAAPAPSGQLGATACTPGPEDKVLRSAECDRTPSAVGQLWGPGHTHNGWPPHTGWAPAAQAGPSPAPPVSLTQLSLDPSESSPKSSREPTARTPPCTSPPQSSDLLPPPRPPARPDQ